MLTEANYIPDNVTPLFDAIGYALNKLRIALDGVSDYSVLVTILTDGEENSSREYTGEAVAALIKNLRSKGWVFTYIGANHDVEKTAVSLNINNSLSFQADFAGTRKMFETTTKSRKNYMNKIMRGEQDLSSEFFKEEKEG